MLAFMSCFSALYLYKLVVVSSINIANESFLTYPPTFFDATATYDGMWSRREKRSSPSHFHCTNGQMIKWVEKCDGKKDCTDESDDTKDACKNKTHCEPKYSFACEYGGCVDISARCNVSTECWDGSDEFDCCPFGGFLCSTRKPNKQCVKEEYVCDGEVHCEDDSDESIRGCSFVNITASTPCDGHRCHYGFCIESAANITCDKERDCLDGSDERGCIATTKELPPPNGSHCRVPRRPNGGERYMDSSTGLVHYEGQNVTANTYLTLECESNHTIQGDSIIQCYTNGSWSTEPKCDKMCDPPTNKTVSIICKLNNEKVDCAGAQRHKTIVWAVCRPMHHGLNVLYSTCDQGRWTNGMPYCKCECGDVPSSGVVTLISKGTVARPGMLPWHVVVYQIKQSGTVYEQICGGTLLNERFFISAAHCFYDQNEKKKEPGNFIVEMGKLLRRQGPEEGNSDVLEKLAVEEIIVPNTYRGYGLNLQTDIALVKLEQQVELNQYILPVCLTDKADEAFKNRGKNMARVVGMGRDENNKPSDQLKYLDVPVIDYDKCKRDMPESFVKYLKDDKICAGYTNGSSVCQGDSGGGLVFENEKKWHMLGIVSVGLYDNATGCRTDRYAAFTSIAHHMVWVREQLKQHDYIV